MWCDAMLTVCGIGPSANGGKSGKSRSSGAGGSALGNGEAKREREGGEVQEQQPVMDPLSQVGSSGRGNRTCEEQTDRTAANLAADEHVADGTAAPRAERSQR